MNDGTQEAPRILALWSAPRSRSTAFLRMMAARGDYTVVHEPFSHVADFSEAQVGPFTARTEAELIATLRELAAREPVFFKDTTDFHYPGLLADERFLTEATHTFIIRHPEQAIASHFKLNAELGRDEIGFAWLAEIYDAVAARSQTPPVVIDSEDLIENPVGTVKEYCARVSIPFVPDALSWQPGVRDDWRKTQRWHESTSRTDGFVRTDGADTDFVRDNPKLAAYLDYHLPYYEHLHAARMRVPS
ncbi:sulfotransferase family protein [Sphaerisporangium sp. NPDC051011]|uniref:sulfotransferase-like domain-containing protein n=1 Tax=Sphaerisporangium sp. NPDC051011 TaxID=3155792 RepID=UPI0033DB17BB